MQSNQQVQSIQSFFESLEQTESKDFMEIVERYISNESIEVICDHIEDFYGVEDDEEIGMLSQLVVTGFLLGKNDSEKIKF